MAGYAYRTGDSNGALPHRSPLVLDLWKVGRDFLLFILNHAKQKYEEASKVQTPVFLRVN